MVQASSSGKNLWVAASDGDLERVQYLIENEGFTPNDKDSNSYTPMHAAASYAHLELLNYLLSKGGNINIPDDDGETPLFVVETLEAARFLVENGAEVGWKNEDGLTAIDQLQEDHPEIASYLLTQLPADQQPAVAAVGGDQEVIGESGISQLALENFTSEQSDQLMQEAQRIMEQCAETGEDPDEKLRELVEGIVKSGLDFAKNAKSQVEGGDGEVDGEGSKRVREE
ncbi:hypothetical protein I204_07140 [Kwoniella mangroviensis CBS 8886]|uniref:hypothetical protein n=1 Tax=Kwoniella mangroviensis CBS 8507 TaxID=1296122 RepID=UPI00080D6E5B|nr:uncharacterized protein I203_05070 [Kwoniella mangroviensis CBS 8507]OCF66047.1 hypothetical protein I203_05070 [Kwoniella mangroviensis CBS 8507]OCF71878.1 hypothetical protein I204_07140 [Kwoniella mangroviensis CBS 8886]